MKATIIGFAVGFASLYILGCTSVSEHPVSLPAPKHASVVEVSPAQKPKPRQWSEKQLNLLRSFALQESPKLWQTVQALRAEHETRTAALAKLRAELVDFGRNPDVDSDYVTLKTANDGLLESLNAVYAKIEDAYIAYKKYQATPEIREYGDMMRRVLDDGLNEATFAESRYLRMSREK